jgi:hypothetical protein
MVGSLLTLLGYSVISSHALNSDCFYYPLLLEIAIFLLFTALNNYGVDILVFNERFRFEGVPFYNALVLIEIRISLF